MSFLARFTRSNVPKERSHFRALLLSNPNYFGNLTSSQLKPVVVKSNDTTYEELGCVGFHPQGNLLNAVVYIKQPTGFDGDICSPGSTEYVRFFASYDQGATWTDLGQSSFTAYNIEEPQKPFVRLEYAVSLPFDPRRYICEFTILVRVRAILSWSVPPPPNQPDAKPVWGNVHDTTIEVEPARTIVLSEALPKLDVEQSTKLSAALDLTQQVNTAARAQLSVPDLAKLYAGTDVKPHRFAAAKLHEVLHGNANAQFLAPSDAATKNLFGIDLDAIEDIIEEFFGIPDDDDDDTTYEQLECVGLNVNTWALEGIVRIKRANGYNGGPCTAGSTEYVTFWADLDGSNAFATCLGTGSVTVYDVKNIPKDGLEFAVTVPTTLFAQRQPCEAGPKLIPIRATLSWQIPPDCSNPSFRPRWGNREETLVCLPPGPSLQPGVQNMFFDTIGSMPVGKIDPLTGLADGASTVGFTADQSPFGGEVAITGYIYPASNISAGELPFKYRIRVSENGGPLIPISDTFTVSRTRIPWGGVPSALPDITQSVDASGITAGYYTYQADWTSNGPGDSLIMVSGNVLAKWQTAGKDDVLVTITLDVYDPTSSTFHYGVASATILLDNVAPNTAITITSGGGPCGDFHIGDQISGTYLVTDRHFSGASLALLPVAGTFTQPVPLPRLWTSIGASTSGDSGTWTLNTAGLPPCGYVVSLSASDRTIVNSGSIGWGNEAYVGFCLKT